jgi:hypothetical protein
MFKKIFKFMFIVIMFALFIARITQAQTTKVIYPVFSISPMGGVQFPLGDFNNTYKTSWNAGLDLNLKINRETSFFLYGGYHDMPAKTESNSPDASVIQITAGPRYIFTSQSIKAQFFIEGGLGVYIFTTKDFATNGTSETITGSTKTNFGINVGPGATIPLGTSVDLIMKVKLHDMFMTGGSGTFITATMGVDFRL